jgi:arylsulfatase A-like enzyme
MERTNLALGGVLALAVIAAGVAFYVAGPSEPAPSDNVGQAGQKAKVKNKLRGPLRKKLNTKIEKGGLRTINIPAMRNDEFGSVVQREKAPDGPPPKGSRLLFVTWDTVRADHVSAYGYFRPTTPNFDSLAAEGLLFENFIVPQATTLPTHVSLFTGVHPDEHGVIGNSDSGARRFIPPPNLEPLARHLTDEGYLTAGFVSSTPLKSFSGAAEGFQTWSEPGRRWRRASETTRIAREWLSEVPEDRPFLAWVHLYDPHAPYHTPVGYEKVFGDESELNPWMEERGLLHEREKLAAKLVGSVDAYDREIRFVDDQLKPLLAELESRGFSDTVVVVVGDHGEGLGQHGHLEHGLVWEEQLAAPLAIRAPGVKPERVTTLTTAQDLLAILAGVADLPNEADLLQQVSGRNVLADRGDRPVLSRLSRRRVQDNTPIGDEPMQWSLHSDTHHFIYRETGAHSLFDRKADPHALNDIAPANPELVAEFAAQVEALNALHAKRAVELGAGKTAPLDAATVEDLKELGYLD